MKKFFALAVMAAALFAFGCEQNDTDTTTDPGAGTPPADTTTSDPVDGTTTPDTTETP